MELKHYRLIKTIAEEGSLANSSEKLFLTQSALSHQLRELEERLGFKVFFRTRNHWTLSEQGQELYKVALKLFETIEEGFGQIRSLNEGSKGQVRLGAECTSFYQGLPAFIQKMGILYPDIEVDIILEATYQPIPKLLSGEIDIALVTTKPSGKNIESVLLCEDEIHCLMHPEHPLAEVSWLEAGHFTDLHVIIHSFPLESVPLFDLLLKPKQINPRKISAIPFTSVAVEMVRANMGVLSFPKWIFDAFRHTEDLCRKRIGVNGLLRNQYLAYRKTDVGKSYIRDFIANFQESFG
ncbi:MAG: LysR family transcriptional regulator [Bacteroidota bacterium]